MIAAPIIRRPLAALPAPGLTDFVAIFIAAELNAEEYRTTLRHEQAHVWGRHNMRAPRGGDVPHWKIACEMEIARNIYDDRDIATIKAPRSRLHGGYLPDTIPELPPDLLLAEDIYDWLLAHPQPQSPWELCACDCEKKETAGREDDGAPPAPTMGEIRDALDAREKEQNAEIAARQAYRSILSRPPSLSEAIDAALRVRVVSEPSYRRPSRRQVAGVILRGRVSTPQPPRVEIFVDRSGSFSPEKTWGAEEKLRSLLQRYRATVKSDVWYFGNASLSATDLPGGGDTPYHLIADHLVRSQPKLAIIITDDDPCEPISARPKATQILCVPIGAHSTNVSKQFRGKDCV